MSEKTAPLGKVYVCDSVVQSCLIHALTTEQEEVMGVLLGEITVHRTPATASASDSLYKRAHVWDSWVLQRSVRRSDRVEIAPEMLAEATGEAERCAAQVGRHTRVIGWYHSHPRITPYPSQVDLHSQRTYQMLESGWVGLIFSVFYSDSLNHNAVSIHCFQTGPGDTHEKIDVEVIPIMQMQLKSLPPCETTHQLLRVFRAEVAAAMDLVKKRCKGAPDAVAAARALQEVQLYTLEKLIAQPTLRYLRATIPLLEREVARLEKELAASSPSKPRR